MCNDNIKSNRYMMKGSRLVKRDKIDINNIAIHGRGTTI